MNTLKMRFKAHVLPMIKTFHKDFIATPFYVLTHALEGSYELQRYRLGLIRVATFYLLIESTLIILKFRYTGFLFNTYNVHDFNYVREVLLRLTPYLLFIVANWSITTLMDGKGKLRDIYNVIGYALFMRVILSIVALFMSNVLTLDEAFFYHGLEFVGFAIMLVMVFTGIMVVHEYSVTKTIFTIIFTFVSAGIMIFIGLLGFSLIQQVYVFIETIFREIILRL